MRGPQRGLAGVLLGKYRDAHDTDELEDTVVAVLATDDTLEPPKPQMQDDLAKFLEDAFYAYAAASFFR